MSKSLIIFAFVAAVAIIGLISSDASINGAYTRDKFTHYTPQKTRDLGQYPAAKQGQASDLFAPKSAGKKTEVKKNQSATKAIPATAAQRVDGTTAPATAATPAVPASPVTCTDSDGGKTYTTRGIVTVGGKEFKDSCRNNYLTEFICKDGKKQSMGILCMECVEGACTRVA